MFDIDSVALLELLHELGTIAAAKAATDGLPDPEQHRFYLGCAIDPFKRLERDLVPQFLKLALKLRSGADYAITQVGYDAHRQDALLRWMRREGIAMPVVGNAYILAAPVARAFNANKVPGCVVTDDLLAVVEREAAAPTRAARSSSSSPPSSSSSAGVSASRASTSAATATRRRSPGSSSSPTPTRPTTGARS